MEEHIPVYGVEHDCLLSKMGDVTVAFKAVLPEIFTLGVRDYENLHEAFVKAIRVLPENCMVCKQDWYVAARYEANCDTGMDFLSRASEKYFHERPYLEHSCYILITQMAKDRKPVTSLFSTLLKKHIVPIELRDEIRMREFVSAIGQFARILGASGLLNLERLGKDALVDLVNGYLNLGDDGVLRDISFDTGVSVGEKQCVLFSIASPEDLPHSCAPCSRYDKFSTDASPLPLGFAAPIGQALSCNHLYSQYVFTGEPAAILKQLESHKLRLQSLSNYSRGNLIARDATNDFLNEAVAHGRQPVYAHFNLLAWDSDPAKLQEIRNDCAGALAQMGVIPKVETVGAAQLFWAGIPGNAGDLPSNETFVSFTDQSVCFFNMETTALSSVSTLGLRLGDRVSGRPLSIDITEEPMRKGIISNRNKIIISPSGSGKSFLINHILRSYAVQGAHVVIIDVGHSYKGLCELLGGYYFTYSEEQPIQFNPFYMEGGGLPDVEKKESIKTLLVTLWKRENEAFARSEYVALSEALMQYYEQPSEFRCFDSFYEFVRDTFSAAAIRDKEFDVAGFLYVLKPFYKGGEFDYLLNAKENLDLLSQSFIVFELDNIKDHPILFPVVTIVIMDGFIAKMRRLKGVPKKLYIEEAWKAIAKHGMAEYIKYMFKTGRKHYAETSVVTQDIEDILSSDIIKQTIINNADCKILLDQSKYQHRFDEIQQLLGLSDKEKAMVLSLNRANDPALKYKEVFISLSGHARVYRVEVSPEEYLTYTTEEKEKVKVMEAASRFGSMEAGIKSLLVLVAMLFCFSGFSQAVDPVSLLIAKVVKEIDLKVQRLQNHTIQLQQVQQLAEQQLAQTKLAEIADWQKRLQELYAKYFEEMRSTKKVIVENKKEKP